MKKEDIEFLKSLQKEMLTQDNFGQASPRYWTVMQTKRIYGIEDGYDTDGADVYYNHEVIAGNFKELCDYLEEHEDEITVDYENNDIEEFVVIDKGTESEKRIEDTNELVEYMQEELSGYESVHFVGYREECQLAENTMFLTLKECEKHIEANHYHYTNPRPYAMTAWRSPQVKRLFEILENTEWDKIGE